MTRIMLRDDQRERIKQMLAGKAGDCGVTAKNNRLFVEAILWVARTGAEVWQEMFAKCAKTLTLKKFSLTARLSASASMRRVRTKKCGRAFARWAEHQYARRRREPEPKGMSTSHVGAWPATKRTISPKPSGLDGFFAEAVSE